MSATTFPFIPDSAPFTPEQRAWLNGFLAGVFPRGTAQVQPASLAPSPPAQPLTILFGSQTGTAEALAKKAAKEAAKRHFAVKIADLGTYDLAKLAGEKNVLAITSTYGDGEPPDSVKPLHAALTSAVARPAAPNPRLASVRFSVCALGDTNYAKFCQCGRDFDLYLEKLGAQRIAPRVDCDLEYDAAFTRWLDTALQALSSLPEMIPPTAGAPPAPGRTAPAAKDIGYSKKNPFPAPILAVRNLNGAGSGKEVNHVEFSLEGSGLVYEAGDALAVVPQNCPQLVSEVIAALGCDGEEAVPMPQGGSTSLRRALTKFYDLGRPGPALIALLTPGDTAPGAMPHVIDLLLATARPRLPDFLAALKKIQPRLYSISSSPKAQPGRVHLTVGAVRYEHSGRARKGTCSTFLAERALAAGHAGVFVHRNGNFRLPVDDARPVIMVGPGTGIAPFRAFLQERQATGARGRNWLFFGDQHEATDFLYRDELLALQRDGVLTRLDLAWSRDKAGKIYVQQRLLERAGELFAWLEAGAYFYVCGDASRMANDVHAALLQVIEHAGGRSPAEAAEYLQQLQSARRYQRDIY